MFNHEIFAVSLGRALELTRAGAPVEERISALSAVYALTSNASAMMRVYQRMLTVDDVGIPDTLPSVSGIIEQMAVHGVAEVAIAKGASPAELLALIRGLASDPRSGGGIQAIKLRLRDVRSTAVMVIPAQAEEVDELRRDRGVAEAFVSEWAGTTPAPEDATPLVELPAIMHTLDLQLGPMSGEVAPSSAPAQLPAGGSEPSEPATAAREPGRVPTLGLPVGPPKGSLAAGLAAVAQQPYGPNILDALTELYLGIQASLADGEVEAAIHALLAIIAWEPEAPAGSPRNSYRIVLQRVLTREHLAQVAPFVSDPRLGAEATKVMQRGGSEAAVVLLGLLTKADALKERRALVTALRGIPEGLEQVVHMLDNQQWFVVRNVAEAMGAQRVEEAVPGLVRCLAHGDLRVRRAAAVALASIGTAATVEPLRHVLKEGDRELRALIAGSVTGHTSRALAMPLVAFAEQESDLDVLREYYRALGRIGTPEAVQALANAAEPGGRLLGRRSSAQRLVAVEGLRIAGGRGAVTALQALAKDGDKAVRELATRALHEIKAREASVRA
jgi:hypothetical protein